MTCSVFVRHLEEQCRKFVTFCYFILLSCVYFLFVICCFCCSVFAVIEVHRFCSTVWHSSLKMIETRLCWISVSLPSTKSSSMYTCKYNIVRLWRASKVPFCYFIADVIWLLLWQFSLTRSCKYNVSWM